MITATEILQNPVARRRWPKLKEAWLFVFDCFGKRPTDLYNIPYWPPNIAAIIREDVESGVLTDPDHRHATRFRIFDSQPGVIACVIRYLEWQGLWPPR